MLAVFAPIVKFLVSGASGLDVPFDVLLYSVLVFIVIFIQKRPQGIFALKGRSAEA